MKSGNGNGAASAVSADRHLTLEDQHREIAGIALHHEDGVGIECLEFGGFDQDREVVVGQLTEGARRSNGGAQLRGIFHVLMAALNASEPALALRPASNSSTRRFMPSKRR